MSHPNEQGIWETLDDVPATQFLASGIWIKAAKKICTISSARELEDDRYEASIRQIERRSENSEWQCDEDIIVAHNGIVHFYEATRRYSIAAQWQERKMLQLNYNFSFEDSNPDAASNYKKLTSLLFLSGREDALDEFEHRVAETARSALYEVLKGL